MKTILLLRHAKAEPIATGQKDFDRPLAPRGREDAARVGRAIAAMDLVPDAIVTSPAARALETAEGAAKAMKKAPALRRDPSLYDAPGSAWLLALRRLEAGVEIVLVVAHNPGAEDAAALLVGSSRAILQCPTAGLVGLDADVAAWKGLREGSAILRFVLRPKLLSALQS